MSTVSTEDGLLLAQKKGVQRRRANSSIHYCNFDSSGGELQRRLPGWRMADDNTKRKSHDERCIHKRVPL